MAGHEAELIIPGSFVVLQGSAGDGVRNTLKSLPEYLPEMAPLLTSSRRSSASSSPSPTPPATSSSKNSNNNNNTTRSLVRHSPSTDGSAMDLDDENDDSGATHILPTVGHLASQNRTLGGLTSQWNTHNTAAAAAASEEQDDETDSNFVVVVSDQDEDVTSASTTTATPADIATARREAQLALETWQGQCRARENQEQEEWKESYRQMVAVSARNSSSGRSAVTTSAALEHSFWNTTNRNQSSAWWLSDSGKLVILRDLPTKLSNGSVLKSVIGTLSPGCTIVATEIVYLNSQTLQRMHVFPHMCSGGRDPHSIYPKGRSGWICLVKIDAFHGQQRTGYAVVSVDGYPLLAPGLPCMYNAHPKVWIWRVTCPAGAFVREGLDLNTRHRDTLPYGSLVRVTRRTVNAQGLSRLRISAVVEDDDPFDAARRRRNSNNSSASGKTRIVEGWCSEFLNPLSGNRGMVLEPLILPVPVIYKVLLREGAVIRQGRELSTPQIGNAPCGSLLKITGRAYSEHPVDNCIERLELAGNGGWISVRLNRPPPHNDLVVDLVEVDSDFDPDTPEMYHWKALRDQDESSPRNQDGASRQQGNDTRQGDDYNDVSSIESEDGPSSPGGKARKSIHNTTKSASTHSKGDKSGEQCLICLTEDRNATMVHGETGHIACCLVCARILKARGDKCPVCRLPIDMVIQHFWA